VTRQQYRPGSRIGLTPEARRERIVARLRAAGVAVPGSELAETLEVSRQVVVGDVAVLRAEGRPIVGTPRGYLLLEPEPAGARVTAVLACRHDRRGTRPELLALVDLGLTVVDVIVEHPLYGELRANLMLRTREDVDRFMERLRRERGELLSSLTGGLHLHTVWAPDRAALEAARGSLRELGVLV